MNSVISLAKQLLAHFLDTPENFRLFGLTKVTHFPNNPLYFDVAEV